MKLISIFLLSIISLCGAYGGDMNNNQPIKGEWSGELDFGGMKLILILQIDREPHGDFTATFESADGSIPKSQVVNILLQNSSLKFELPLLASIYEGNVNKDETEISGKLIYNNEPYPLNLKKGVLDKGLFKKPQEPLPPFPYIEDQIKFENPSAGVTLSGTLTLPTTKGQFPAVVLIAGSAPYDRDATQSGHKPFMVLADHLTRNGIAVLRFDKRGVNQSTGIYEAADGRDFADDVLAGVNYLKTRPEINHQQIGLVGHSEGGVLAPMVAVKSQDIAFLMLMAGAAVNGKEIMLEQHALNRRADGVSEKEIAEESSLLNEVYDLVINEKQIYEVLRRYAATKPNLSITGIEINESSLDNIVARISTPWFRYFLINEPALYLKQLKIPIFALYFELDSQVSPKQNIPMLSKTLKEAHHPNYSIKELSKHNHMLQSCKTGSIAEYVQSPETVSPLILNLVTEWIQKRLM